MRDMLFVSHANPEDNEFTRWVTLQLAGLGYPVWCDLTKLLGGEDFWHDIEQAIRTRTVKFLYVLSHTSNSKPGALKELSVAENVLRDEGLERFIIPLAIDDLPPRHYNIQLARIQAVSFRPSWADGLAQVLKRLEDDRVARDPRFSPEAVAKWWRENFDSARGVQRKPELLVSNFFPLASSTRLYFHRLSSPGGLPPDTAGTFGTLPCPSVVSKDLLITLTPPSAFQASLSDGISIRRTTALPLGFRHETKRRRFGPGMPSCGG
jgi:hypothetical protein